MTGVSRLSLPVAAGMELLPLDAVCHLMSMRADGGAVGNTIAGRIHSLPAVAGRRACLCPGKALYCIRVKPEDVE